MDNPAHVPLSIDSLAKLDQGRFGRAVNMCIRNIYNDMYQRPADMSGKTQKRKLTITLEFEPVVANDGDGFEMIGASMVPRVKGAVPDMIGNPTTCGLIPLQRPDGSIVVENGNPVRQLAFNELSPANFLQLPLFAQEEEQEVESEDG